MQVGALEETLTVVRLGAGGRRAEHDEVAGAVARGARRGADRPHDSGDGSADYRRLAEHPGRRRVGAMQQTYMSAHGMSASQTTVLVDGLMVNGLDGDGAVQNYFNSSMSQEMVYTTFGASAEVSGGGVRLNMIPKDGGNSSTAALRRLPAEKFPGRQSHRRVEGARPANRLTASTGCPTSKARSAVRSGGPDLVLPVGPHLPPRHAARRRLQRRRLARRRSAEHQQRAGAASPGRSARRTSCRCTTIASARTAAPR